jgi:hypothetical protein
MWKQPADQVVLDRKRSDASVTGRRPKRPIDRYFFVAMGLFAIFVALIPFGPEFVKIASGSFPLAWILHLHGALMTPGCCYSSHRHDLPQQAKCSCTGR